VRKHLSAVKGGRLALAAAPARVVTLAISDVPGDDPAVIASGPTVPDGSTREEARRIVTRYAPNAPPGVLAWLDDARSETPKSLPDADVTLIATAAQALAAAADHARDAGYAPLILGDAIEGEAREVAHGHAAIVHAIRGGDRGPPPPCVLLSGGETTVTVCGAGRGGRNTEYLLALCEALGSAPGVHALAADTDGIDGTEDNAGGIIGPDTLIAARALNLSARDHLARNDSYAFLDRVGGLVRTGPTLTNVNDFRAILIDPI
jgi:hydroxypyruvate reductase